MGYNYRASLNPLPDCVLKPIGYILETTSDGDLTLAKCVLLVYKSLGSVCV